MYTVHACTPYVIPSPTATGSFVTHTLPELVTLSLSISIVPYRVLLVAENPPPSWSVVLTTVGFLMVHSTAIFSSYYVTNILYSTSLIELY